MAKTPIPLFCCLKCDTQLLKWSGQCPECGAWGSVKDIDGAAPGVAAPAPTRTSGSKPGAVQAFRSLTSAQHAHHKPTGLAYWDRVLSGGIVPGSVTLLGGEPGIGKSTLLAQLAILFAKAGGTVLYVTGEESPAQVLNRLTRLQSDVSPNLQFLDDTRAETIAETIRHAKPALTIVDSIQSVRMTGVVGEAGNPTQIKASAAVLHEAAKQTNASVILVGQVTKDGELAGPRLLEHLVDSVLMLEGDRTHAFRLLHVYKHRFGTTEESAVLQMNERGLEEVLDPSAALLADRPKGAPGTIVTCFPEGIRPLLVEIQALVSPAGYATPARRTSGIDTNRLNLLLAVLTRRCGIPFGEQDVFVNAVGGIHIDDPSVDLGIALALASAKLDIAIPESVCAWGEVGLAGELRPVSLLNQRIKEAQRLGFTTIIIPAGGQEVKGPGIIRCKTLREALDKVR
ncbi:DNA repair protein RadA [Patescibacteria group bacterium]|nr:DNA repair protein RadA [Patescibacteria group bacterium]